MMKKISGVILAGGLARRMNGAEKGLQLLHNEPLIRHIVRRLSPQFELFSGKNDVTSGEIWLNINRHFAEFQAAFPELPTFSDDLADFQGALSGMLTAFKRIESDYLLFVPCDSPFLPENLLAKLFTALRINQAQIAYAHDGERPHPTFALLYRSVLPELEAYLATGERRIWHFFHRQHAIAVDFSEQPQAFQNLNSLEDLALLNAHPATKRPAKVLAVTGYSGTGKTTLLEKLLPELTSAGLNVALIKHSHHNVDLDKQGKDSYRLRQAGANPTVIACDQRWAIMTETPAKAVKFADIFADLCQLQPDLDLVLVEGFKGEELPKIQLHRKDLDKPLPELDRWTVATATDYPLPQRKNLLDINNIKQIADFVRMWLKA